MENALAKKEGQRLSSLQEQNLKAYFSDEKAKAQAMQDPFKAFYADASSKSVDFDFPKCLGVVVHALATEDAKTCLTISHNFLRISQEVIGNWLSSALKFADHLVLHYIQEYCKEAPKSFPALKTGLETSRYEQIKEKGGDIAVAGQKLRHLYDQRNDFEHRTKVNKETGKQELIPVKKNKLRNEVTKHYPIALQRLLAAFKSAYPTFAID